MAAEMGAGSIFPALSSSVHPTNTGAKPLDIMHLSIRDDGGDINLGEIARADAFGWYMDDIAACSRVNTSHV